MSAPTTSNSNAPHNLPGHQLVACEECDAVYQRKPLRVAERAYCLCCGAALYRDNKPINTLLPLVITTLIIFIIANSFPIVQIEMQGLTAQTTLLQAVWAMMTLQHGMVGLLVLLTTFLVPLLDNLLLLYILLPIHLYKKKPRQLVRAMNTLAALRGWSMVEVFLIGVLVTLVKLAGMVIVIPGIAMWAFAALSLLQVWICAFKIKDLWHDIDSRSLDEESTS